MKVDLLNRVRDVDNRPLEEIVAYLEARVDALTRRNHELEIENAELRRQREIEPALRLDVGEPLERAG